MKHIISLIIMVSISLAVIAFNGGDNFGHRSELLPDEVKLQFAGNIGFLAAGIGYETFGGKLNSDLLIGYLPEYIGKAEVLTIAQKNTFNFRNFKYKPIRRLNVIAGFSINVESGKNAFLRLPDYYPGGYYSTNAITFGLFTGLKYNGKYSSNSKIKQIEYFAEVGTLATYVYYAIYNEDYFEEDIYSLALGMNLKF